MNSNPKHYTILYYLSPFLLTPVLAGITNLIAELPGIKPYMFPILCILFCLYGAVLAMCSGSAHTYDFLITLFAPLSLLVMMFLLGFLEQTETRSRFDWEHALDIALQLPGLFLYLCMTVTSFIASHKKFRIRKRR